VENPSMANPSAASVIDKAVQVYAPPGTQDLTNEELSAPPAHPSLPQEALHGLFGEIIRAAAVLLSALTYAGAIFGSGCYVAVGETNQPPRLYVAIVGASSRARKGTSFGPVKRIFQLAETLALQSMVNVVHGPLSSGEGIVYAVRDPSDALDKDTGLPIDAGVVDKRLFVLEGEFGAPLKAIQRDGNTLSAILRMAWDDGHIAPLTKSNRIKATGAHLCVVGHITRNELMILLQGSDIWNGLANRILWTCGRRQKLVPFPQPMPENIVNELAGKIAKALSRAKGRERVYSSEATRQLWTSIYPALTQDKPGVLDAVTARAEAQVTRLALIYALMDNSAMIEPIHLRAALAVWSYCEQSARFIFGDSETDPDVNKILLALTEGDKTQTELNNLFSGHLDAGKLNRLLTDLQSVGRISQTKKGGGKNKGRSATIWNLSPGFNPPCAEFANLAE
jgi:hypothetical protein